MNFNFLKLKKKGLPSLNSLRAKIFDVEKFWFITLGSCTLIIVITLLIGLSFFFPQYFESYKKTKPTDSFEKIIDIDKLKSVVNERNELINNKITIPPDPSI